MFVNEKECEKAGIDPKEINRIGKGLSRYGKEAKKLGFEVFGGSGTGTLRFDDGGKGRLILAYIDGPYNGGDGSTCRDGEELERGEY